MRPIFIWHRYIGLAIAPLILLMLITALFLNHSEGLKLATKHVTSNSILSWYGMKAPETIKGYELKGKWIFEVGNDIYLDKTRLELSIKGLKSAIYLKDTILLIDNDSLYLMTLDGRLIEKMGQAHGLPEELESIGLINSEYIVVKGEAGFFKSDMNFLSWEPLLEKEIEWAMSKPLPEKINQFILNNYRGKGPSYERLLLDLHSGRFMGKYGVVIMDTFSALFLMLSLFGIWIWAWGKKRK